MVTWSRDHAATSGRHGRRRWRRAVLVVSSHRAVRAVRRGGGGVLRRRSHRSTGAAPRRQVAVRPGTGEVACRQHAAVGARHGATGRVKTADRRLVMMVQVGVVHLADVLHRSSPSARSREDVIFCDLIASDNSSRRCGVARGAVGFGESRKVAKYRASESTGNSVYRPLIASRRRARSPRGTG